MSRKKINKVVEKEIADFEIKHGSANAFKWGGKWVKKKAVLNVGKKK